MAAPKGNQYALGNKGGRPSSYDPKYCQEIVEFFDRQPYEPVMYKNEDGETVPLTDQKGNVVTQPCMLPTKERFAFSIGVNRHTLVNWANEHEEFFTAIKYAEDMQKDILIQNGLLGGYDKTFAIFTAKNVTDMHDKQVIEQTTTATNFNIETTDPKEAAQEYLEKISQSK